MLSISMFHGIIVYKYFQDTKQHNLPHIHIEYQEYKAIISIPDANIIEGEFPNNKLNLVRAWIEIHKDEPMACWKLAANGKQIYKIEPLRVSRI
ncbi:MAG: DUF4160 domain-containing protein [Candidatus Kapabacteria bacterium]|nr:DUF4160 domain-containing protein [Candidatus Kapabacteria bacterium]